MLIPKSCIKPFNAFTPSLNDVSEAYVLFRLLELKSEIDRLPKWEQNSRYQNMDPFLCKILKALEHLTITIE